MRKKAEQAQLIANRNLVQLIILELKYKKGLQKDWQFRNGQESFLKFIILSWKFYEQHFFIWKKAIYFIVLNKFDKTRFHVLANHRTIFVIFPASFFCLIKSIENYYCLIWHCTDRPCHMTWPYYIIWPYKEVVISKNWTVKFFFLWKSD